jgi:hypothetical protein
MTGVAKLASSFALLELLDEIKSFIALQGRKNDDDFMKPPFAEGHIFTSRI